MCSFHVLQSGVISKKIYVNFVAKLWEKHISLNPQHRLHLLTYKAEDDYPNQACFAKKVMNKLEEDEHKRYVHFHSHRIYRRSNIWNEAIVSTNKKDEKGDFCKHVMALFCHKLCNQQNESKNLYRALGMS